MLASKVANTGSMTAIGAATIGGGGSANVVTKFDTTGANVINSSISDNGSRIHAGEGVDFSSDFSFVGNAEPAATGRVQMFDRAFVGFVIRGLNVLFETLQGSPAVPTEVMRVTQGGNVGIGTSAPGQKLEVAGNLKLSGTGNAIIFPNGTVMGSAATSVGRGTITGVTAGTGLTGGGTSGGVTLSNTGVLSFSGRSGSVTPNIGDYSFAQISSTASKFQLPTVTAYADQDNGFSAAQTFNKSITGTSASFSGSGTTAVVFGRNTTPTNFTVGVQGFSDSIDGMGVQGQALASSGSTFGVRGTAMSPSGIGVSGLSPGTGVKGEGSGTAATGILALSLAGSGSTTGLVHWFKAHWGPQAYLTPRTWDSAQATSCWGESAASASLA